jgi:hypothetical protein
MTCTYEVTDTFVPSRGHQVDRLTLPPGAKKPVRETAVFYWGHRTDKALSKQMADKTAASANAVLAAKIAKG